MNQVLVVDMNVIAYQIISVLDKLAGQKYDLTKIVEAQMHYVASGLWLKPDATPENEALGFVPLQNHTVIWCNDVKPYWRSGYLLRDAVWSKIVPVKRGKKQVAAPIVYKGGRKQPTNSITMVRSSMRMVIVKNQWLLLEGMCDSHSGYEADDMAALLCRLNSKSANPQRLYLLTCDHDWLGLIDTHVSWLNTYSAYPRYRNMTNWNAGYSLCDPSNPESIWVQKAGYGDKSDNLPSVGGNVEGVGALLPVIDLKNPPTEFDPMQDERLCCRATEMLGSAPTVSNGMEVEKLKMSGMPLCVNMVHHTSN